MDGFSTSHIVMGAFVAVVLLGAGALIGRWHTSTPKDRGPRLVKRTRQVGTFEARDSMGKLYILSIYQEYLDAGTTGDPDAERRGRRIIMSSDGRHVDKVATRKYRIMGTTATLTSDDANAP
jgi:hypothetical protein